MDHILLATAPSSIQRRKSAITASGSFARGGICKPFGSCSKASTTRLSADLPGTTIGPESPPLSSLRRYPAVTRHAGSVPTPNDIRSSAQRRPVESAFRTVPRRRSGWGLLPPVPLARSKRGSSHTTRCLLMDIFSRSTRQTVNGDPLCTIQAVQLVVHSDPNGRQFQSQIRSTLKIRGAVRRSAFGPEQSRWKTVRPLACTIAESPADNHFIDTK